MRPSGYLRLIILAALGILALTLAAPAVYRLVARNLYAVSVMQSILAGAAAPSISTSAPRQQLWLARHALRRGDLPLTHPQLLPLTFVVHF